MKTSLLKAVLAAVLLVLASASAVFADVIAEPRVTSVFVQYWPYILGFVVFLVIVMVVQHVNNKRDR